jgi:glutathione S-transferase
MPEFIVHGIPGSPYVRAALLSLEEKGADYHLAAMQFGTLKQEPHLSIFAAAPEGQDILWRQRNLKDWLQRIEARPACRIPPGTVLHGWARKRGDANFAWVYAIRT